LRPGEQRPVGLASYRYFRTQRRNSRGHQAPGDVVVAKTDDVTMASVGGYRIRADYGRDDFRVRPHVELRY
jgi:hypothetical protein